ncbi:MAG: hypothetical protein HXY34_08960 [Candidatus Thorarchaeota archaeon]|nr:hypothetical protein [Candidatus Thorarchaeota archaeon]
MGFRTGFAGIWTSAQHSDLIFIAIRVGEGSTSVSMGPSQLKLPPQTRSIRKVYDALSDHGTDDPTRT